MDQRTARMVSLSPVVATDTAQPRPLPSRAPDSSGLGAPRTVTVLAAELGGIAALAERASPEDLSRLLREWMRAVALVASLRGAWIESFSQDRAVLVFGSHDDPVDPNAHANDAVDVAI